MAQFKYVGSLSPRADGTVQVRSAKKPDGTRTVDLSVRPNEIFVVADEHTKIIDHLEQVTNPLNRAEKLYTRVS
tara:strand:+ start:419 stop:640 length:222 start_codon:yes stop_codon:yes gene_type:complete